MKQISSHSTSAASTATRLPPRIPGHPLLGNLREIQREGLGFLVKLIHNYGNVAGYRLGTLRPYLVSHPEDIRHVLQDNQKNYSRNIVTYRMLRQLVGNGILTSDGSFWLRQRRLAQPAFHRERIANMGTIMTDTALSLVERWDSAAQHGQPLTIAEEMMSVTLQVVSKALLGSDMGNQVAQVGHAFDVINRQLYHRVQSLLPLPPILPTRRDRQFRAARKSLDDTVAAIIAARRQSGSDGGDLLSMLLHAEDADTGERMNDRQLRDEVMTILLAGHETTATLLTWIWALLALHPEVEARLHTELDTTLQGITPGIADLPRLPYTRMVIDEALRLYPPAFIFHRRAEQADLVGGYHIPAGTMITVSPYATHRHPDFWEQPDQFIPERFDPAQDAQRPRFAYFPFGGGPHLCIGNNFALTEAQLVLATLAQRYRLRLLPGFKVEPELHITLRVRGGLPAIIERRSPTQ